MADKTRRLKVLVVENDEANANDLTAILRQQGHEVRVVTDAAQAVLETMTDVPEAILIEIDLPGMDGCQVARGVP